MNNAAALHELNRALAHFRRRQEHTPTSHSAHEIAQISVLAEYLYASHNLILCEPAEDEQTHPSTNEPHSSQKAERTPLRVLPNPLPLLRHAPLRSLEAGSSSLPCTPPRWRTKNETGPRWTIRAQPIGDASAGCPDSPTAKPNTNEPTACSLSSGCTATPDTNSEKTQAFLQELTTAYEARERQREQRRAERVLSPQKGPRFQPSLERFRTSAKYADRPAAADIAFCVAALSSGMEDARIEQALTDEYLSRDPSQSKRAAYVRRTMNKARDWVTH